MEKTNDPVAVHSVRWPYMLIGIISMLFAGIIYAWSILKAPLAQTFGWTASGLALNFTLTMCFFCVGGVLSGILTRKTSPRVSVIISAFLVAFGFIIVSRMSGESIGVLYFAYGGMGGLGIGMAYNAIISSTNMWFPDKKGACSGALMMGFGASALVLGNLAEKMIDTESFGWRNTYLTLGIAIGAVLLITGLVVRFPPAGTQFPQPKASQQASFDENFETRDYTTAEMVRRFTFWRFFLFSVFTAAVGNTVISFARDLSISVGAEAALAAALVGVLSICNGLGRIIFGFLFDALGRRRTMLACSVLVICAAVVLLLSVLSHSLPVGIVGLCLTGMSYGSSPTITAAFVGTFYGSKYFPANFSIANLVLIPASFTATLAGSLVTSTGSFVTPCMILMVFAILSLLLCLSIKHP